MPLQIGDTLELNDHRAVVVGICRVTRTFQSQPMVYTTYSRATIFAPRERKLLSFILVKAKGGESLQSVCDRIRKTTGLAAYTHKQFVRLTLNYFHEEHRDSLNFGITVFLGFLVGTAIAGQTFYLFTVENIRQFGALKAMGTGNGTILGMVLFQAAQVGIIGYGIGVGLATLFGWASRGFSRLSFFMPWQVLAITAAAVIVIVLVASLLSIRRVLVVDPAIVFRG